MVKPQKLPSLSRLFSLWTSRLPDEVSQSMSLNDYYDFVVNKYTKQAFSWTKEDFIDLDSSVFKHIANHCPSYIPSYCYHIMAHLYPCGRVIIAGRTGYDQLL